MTFAHRLRSEELLLGMQSFSGSAVMIEALGHAGFDFVMIDLEHALIEIEQAADLVRAATGVGVASLVRVRENEPSQISKALATGADGIIVPRVNSAAEAKAAVQSARLPPLGRRKPSLDASYAGKSGSYVGRMQALDDRTVTVALIEDIAGVDAIESILDVEGIDALLFGPADFGMSIGAGKRGFDGEVQRATLEAMDHVIESARRRRIPVLTTPIFNVLDANGAIGDLFARGVRAVLYSIDTMVTRAALAKLRHEFETRVQAQSTQT